MWNGIFRLSDFFGFSSALPLPVAGMDGGVAPVSDVRADAPAGIVVTDSKTAAATLSQHNVPAPVTAVIQQLVNALVASGRGDDDYSGLATVIFDLAGLEHPLTKKTKTS